MIKDYAKSKKAKLLNIAQQEQLQYQMLITRYLFKRLLYWLSASKYKEKFCLKGGTLLYALAKETPRPTLDIDFETVVKTHNSTIATNIRTISK